MSDSEDERHSVCESLTAVLCVFKVFVLCLGSLCQSLQYCSVEYSLKCVLEHASGVILYFYCPTFVRRRDEEFHTNTILKVLSLSVLYFRLGCSYIQVFITLIRSAASNKSSICWYKKYSHPLLCVTLWFVLKI